MDEDHHEPTEHETQGRGGNPEDEGFGENGSDELGSGVADRSHQGELAASLHHGDGEGVGDNQHPRERRDDREHREQPRQDRALDGDPGQLGLGGCIAAAHPYRLTGLCEIGTKPVDQYIRAHTGNATHHDLRGHIALTDERRLVRGHEDRGPRREPIGGAVPGDADHGERRRGAFGGESVLVTEHHTEVAGGGGIERHLTGFGRGATLSDVPPGRLGIGDPGLGLVERPAALPDDRPVGREERRVGMPDRLRSGNVGIGRDGAEDGRRDTDAGGHHLRRTGEPCRGRARNRVDDRVDAGLAGLDRGLVPGADRIGEREGRVHEGHTHHDREEGEQVPAPTDPELAQNTAGHRSAPSDFMRSSTPSAVGLASSPTGAPSWKNTTLWVCAAAYGSWVTITIV